MMRMLTGWPVAETGLPRLWRQLFWRLAALGAALVLGLVATPARADLYHYTYTGNAFTMTAQEPVWFPGDPAQGRDFLLESISAEFYTAAPLSTGTSLSDLIGFTMTISPWYGTPWTLVAPADVPPCPGCPPVDVQGSFSIGAMSDLGLPGAWDFWLSHDATYPTGRHMRLTLASTQTLDSVTGGYEGFVSYSGGLTLSPGVWAVALVAPEPATVVMFGLGVAIIGWFAWRRRSSA